MTTAARPENWIKELKLDIHADRLSCHRFRANAFRLQLHSVALLLLAYFRRGVQFLKLDRSKS